MKLKTINKVIRNKMSEWLDTITDKDLRVNLVKNVIVTGGCIASMLQQEDVNDFDVYIEDEKVCYDLACYYAEQIKDNIRMIPVCSVVDMKQVCMSTDDWKHIQRICNDPNRVRCFMQSDGVYRASDYMPSVVYTGPGEAPVPEKAEYTVAYITENAITLSDKVQIVTRFTGDVSTIHENYDFVHATNYWTYKTGLVTNKEALASLLTRELTYTGSKYPLCSIIRTRKFVQRKWTVNAGQYLKMCMQLNDLDLRDINVLKDQLTGVDSAYFCALIIAMERELRRKYNETPNAENILLPVPYIIDLIDEIFGCDMESE